MIRIWRTAGLSLAVVAAAAIGLSIHTSGAAAKGEPKEPTVDCSLKKNKNHSKCKKHREMSDDELYHAGYWLARKGEYAAALDYLRQSRDMNAPRVLTYIGFSLRKLGNWQEAMPYYERALAIDPNYVVARSYLGEAMLQAGDVHRARGELGEIERRCGTACEEFITLKDALAKHQARSS